MVIPMRVEMNNVDDHENRDQSPSKKYTTGRPIIHVVKISKAPVREKTRLLLVTGAIVTPMIAI